MAKSFRFAIPASLLSIRGIARQQRNSACNQSFVRFELANKTLHVIATNRRCLLWTKWRHFSLPNGSCTFHLSWKACSSAFQMRLPRSKQIPFEHVLVSHAARRNRHTEIVVRGKNGRSLTFRNRCGKLLLWKTFVPEYEPHETQSCNIEPNHLLTLVKAMRDVNDKQQFLTLMVPLRHYRPIVISNGHSDNADGEIEMHGVLMCAELNLEQSRMVSCQPEKAKLAQLLSQNAKALEKVVASLTSNQLAYAAELCRQCRK